MKYSEATLSFDCSGEQLVGILAAPEVPASTAVLVIVGGPQYRVGSHRQFLLMSRRLAAAGYATLRFDYRGMGDSSGAMRHFEDVGKDIAAAIDALQQAVPSAQDVVLWGLCDGASAALLYCGETRDPRVRGLCLLNPWVRSVQSLARTQVKHYYSQRLRQKEFWLKLLSGKVAWAALSGLAANLRLSASRSKGARADQRSYQQRMAEACKQFPGHIALLLSGQDYVAKEFIDHATTDIHWSGLLQRPQLLRHDVADVDHTFSSAAARQMAEDLTLDWLAERNTPPAAAIPHARGR